MRLFGQEAGEQVARVAVTRKQQLGLRRIVRRNFGIQQALTVAAGLLCRLLLPFNHAHRSTAQRAFVCRGRARNARANHQHMRRSIFRQRLRGGLPRFQCRRFGRAHGRVLPLNRRGEMRLALVGISTRHEPKMHLAPRIRKMMQRGRAGTRQSSLQRRRQAVVGRFGRQGDAVRRRNIIVQTEQPVLLLLRRMRVVSQFGRGGQVLPSINGGHVGLLCVLQLGGGACRPSKTRAILTVFTVLRRRTHASDSARGKRCRTPEKAACTLKTEVQAAFGMRRTRQYVRQSRQKGSGLCHGRPLQAWVWRRNAMQTAATHRLRGKKSVRQP